MSRDRVYLRHILDATTKIESYVGVGRDRFLNVPHWHDATIHQLEVIGEATKRLCDDLRARYPDVPCRRIAGLQGVLTHRRSSTPAPVASL